MLLPFPPSARAVIFGDHLCAFVALDGAAPVELAVAAADGLGALPLHSQAALLAQPAAAPPLPLRRVAPVAPNTLPPLGALHPQALVLHAVVRRVLQVNKLRSRDALERERRGRSAARAVPGPRRLLIQLQLPGVFVLLLQEVPHLSEAGQLHPARLDGAAP